MRSSFKPSALPYRKRRASLPTVYTLNEDGKTLTRKLKYEYKHDENGQVLVEDVDDHDASYVTGRMTNNILVHFPGSKDLIGTLVNVRLTECRGFYYMGEQENA